MSLKLLLELRAYKHWLDSWSMVFKGFVLLLLSFLHKRRKLLKELKEVWKVKISFISKINFYLFGAFVHDQ